jgi:hypothetical protein
VNHDDATRARKLLGLRERLKQGENVQNRDLQTWLGADGYKLYEDAWAAQKDLREELGNKPAEIVEYERRLKKANFTYNKAEGYDRTFRFRTAELEYGDAEKQYVRLLERLQEIIVADPSLRVWFDRDASATRDGGHNIEPSHMPQVVTSKSPHNCARNGGLQLAKLKKQAVKIDAIEHELARLEAGDKTQKLRAKRATGIPNMHPERASD